MSEFINACEKYFNLQRVLKCKKTRKLDFGEYGFSIYREFQNVKKRENEKTGFWRIWIFDLQRASKCKKTRKRENEIKRILANMDF